MYMYPNLTKNIPNSKTKFDQFKQFPSAAFVNVDLGKSSDTPLLIAVRASVPEVRQAVRDIVAAWRIRGDNSNSGASTSAERVCDSLASWSSAEKVETVSISLQSLQLGVSLLVLARKQIEGKLDPREVNFMCESFNQKRSAQSVSFPLSVDIYIFIF